jgi:hypothetical protein
MYRGDTNVWALEKQERTLWSKKNPDGNSWFVLSDDEDAKAKTK